MRCPKLILSTVISILVFLNNITLYATNFADYEPLTLGSYWTYQNAADPTDIYIISVFEKFMFNGNPAVKIGTDDCNYNIGYNDGLAINI